MTKRAEGRRAKLLRRTGGLVGLVSMLGASPLLGAQAPLHFPLPTPTPASMTIAGTVRIAGALPPPGTEVAALAPTGTICGAAVVDLAAGGVFVLHVYGDDDTTPDRAEGPTDGAAVTFAVFDPAQDAEVPHADLLVTSGAVGFLDRLSLRADIAMPAESDEDGDGVADAADAFPFDPAASIDTDGDGAPDAWNPGQDADDSTTRLALDAFPLDPTEQADLDGDGVGDNTDPDDDGDGFTDAWELAAGSDPSDPASVPSRVPPVQPLVLGITPDVFAPLTLFRVVLSPFEDPDAPGSTPSAVEWSLYSDTLECELCLLEFRVGGVPTALELPSGLLSPGTRILASVRYVDAEGLRSDWSALFPVDLPVDPADQDGDGVEDRAEVAEATDLDGDGVSDRDEGLTVFREPEGGALVGLELDAGRLERLYVARRSELPEGQRPPLPMPYGLYGFRVGDLPVGAPVTVTFHLPTRLPPGARWYKTGPASGPVDYTENTSADGTRVTVHVTDGGRGDADGTPNGIVVDPGGAAIAEQLPEDPATSDGGGGGGCFLRTLGRSPVP